MSPFDPDWVISPGETLFDWMDENGFVRHADYGDAPARPMLGPVAKACGRMEPAELQRILDGKRRITPTVAAKLQAGTGIPARLWLNLERQFRQGLAEGKTWRKT